MAGPDGPTARMLARLTVCNQVVIWHVVHPLYFFACLMVGGGLEGIVAAIGDNHDKVYNWKVRLVMWSIGSVIVLSTLINVTHSDSKVCPLKALFCLMTRI